MEIFLGILVVLGFLFLFLLGNVLMLPFGKMIDKRLAQWPDRPMTDGERKAAWSVKYHQATPIQPNTFFSKGNDNEPNN